MSSCLRVLILHLSISPKIPSPHVCEEAAATAQWGQMARVEMVARQHLQLRVITLHPLATSIPSQLQAHSNHRPHTHTLSGPVTESVSWNPAVLLTRELISY